MTATVFVGMAPLAPETEKVGVPLVDWLPQGFRE
jgi:hypothetical protein